VSIGIGLGPVAYQQCDDLIRRFTVNAEPPDTQHEEANRTRLMSVGNCLPVDIALY